MNLKMRSALLFGLIVTVLLSVIFSIIYFQNEWFRKDDFLLRLRQKALTTYKLLVDENQIDSSLLQVIDRSSLDKLYDESISVFNNNDVLIYSSQKEKQVNITNDLIGRIRKKKVLHFNEGEREGIGLVVTEGSSQGIVIASAFDKYGKRKLSNLFFILSVCWLGGILITGIVSYIYVKRIFKPVDMLNEKIQEVTEGNLQKRVSIGSRNSELAKMASNFNRMMGQLEQSFNVQKNFLQHASHELRTPLSNLLLQTEAAMNKELDTTEYKNVLVSIYDDQKYLVDMVNSILSLSKYSQQELTTNLQPVRVDELLFEAADELRLQHSEYNIQIDFSQTSVQENELVIKGIPELIRVVFTNLIRNGCVYSTSSSMQIAIIPGISQIVINFLNDGPLVPAEEREKLFMPFFRGSNITQERGHGLGLSICRQIVDVHKGRLFYTVSEEGLNCFTVIFFHF